MSCVKRLVYWVVVVCGLSLLDAAFFIPTAGAATLFVSSSNDLVNGDTSCPQALIDAEQGSSAGGNDGIVVNRGSNAVINNNSVYRTGGNGVVVDQLAFSVITNNTIQNNPGAGVFVSENSTARIGFNQDNEAVASPNTIQNNAVGIIVSNGSSARVIGTTIHNHTGAGIQVLRDSHADIASNSINSNGGNGIEVGENSIVQLGEDSGTSIYESANTTTSTNTGFGLRCFTDGIADGRLGTLNGIAGAKSFSDPSCIDSLN